MEYHRDVELPQWVKRAAEVICGSTNQGSRGGGVHGWLSPGCVTECQSRCWIGCVGEAYNHRVARCIQTQRIRLLCHELLDCEGCYSFPDTLRAPRGAITSGSIVICSAKLTLRINTSPAPRDETSKSASSPKLPPHFLFILPANVCRTAIAMSRGKKGKAKAKSGSAKSTPQRAPSKRHSYQSWPVHEESMFALLPNRRIEIGPC
jgi:hypothetical protein